MFDPKVGHWGYGVWLRVRGGMNHDSWIAALCSARWVSSQVFVAGPLRRLLNYVSFYNRNSDMGLIRFHECLVFFPMTIYLNVQRGLQSISCGSFSLQGTIKWPFPGSVNLKWENGLFKWCLVQREAIRWASGSVKFVSSVSYLPCLQHSRNLGPAYSRAL